jgi:aryl-alcohol dehydrogenase-like predicted oxidoreductase
MTEVAMSLSLYALTCGHLEGEFGRFMEGGEGNITAPIPVFLIEHPKGRALFDTGLHPDCQYDAAGRLGERMTNLFKISFRPGEEVSARLEAIDRDPARIDLVINSHFHFDHVGGNALIPNATMLVQHREWDASMDPDTAARHGYNSRDFDLGHNHRLIGEAIRGRRHDVVIHSKSGSPRDGRSDAVRGGGDPRYLRRTCEQSLKNLGVDTLDVFCMSRVDPNVPIEESVGGMAELVKEGKTRFISLSECSAESLRRGSVVHPLVSLQMEYSLFSRDAEEQGQNQRLQGAWHDDDGLRGARARDLSAQVPKVKEMSADDVRAQLPRFHSANVENNLRLRSALEAVARRKNTTLAQLAIAWPMAQGSRAGAFIVPIPGAKSRKHLEENVRAADIVLTAHDLAEIDRIVPPGAASGTRYPIGQMHRVNL